MKMAIKLVVLTYVIISLLICQHLMEWCFIKYIPLMITRLNFNHERKSRMTPPRGMWKLVRWFKCVSMFKLVCKYLHKSVCVHALFSFCRTSLCTDTYSCLVVQRGTWSHVMAVTDGSFSLSCHPYSPSFALFRLWGRGEDETSQPSDDPAVHHPVQECKGGL